MKCYKRGIAKYVMAMVDVGSDLYLEVDLVGSTVKTPSTDGMIVVCTSTGLIILERKLMTRE
jgi:hypothetical protein